MLYLHQKNEFKYSFHEHFERLFLDIYNRTFVFWSLYWVAATF